MEGNDSDKHCSISNYSKNYCRKVTYGRGPMMELIYSGKYSSFLDYFKNYSCKKFYSIGFMVEENHIVKTLAYYDLVKIIAIKSACPYSSICWQGCSSREWSSLGNSTLMVVSQPYPKYLTRVEVNDSDKHSITLDYNKIDSPIKLYSTRPREEINDSDKHSSLLDYNKNYCCKEF